MGPVTDEPKETISFSVRLTEKQRELLSRAAEKRGWSLTSLLKNAALEKAIHILNTSSTNRIDFRQTAEEIARQVFTPRTLERYDREEEQHLPEPVYEGRYDPQSPADANEYVLSPWHKDPGFVDKIRDAARYGGTEFLDLIIQACETITARNEPNLPDPIDLGSV